MAGVENGRGQRVHVRVIESIFCMFVGKRGGAEALRNEGENRW